MCDHMAMQSQIIREAINAWDGESDLAMHWLKDPNSALDGESPWSKAQTAEGLEEVRRLMKSLGSLRATRV